MPRNMFLFNNAIYLLPYTGVGSGITRALDEDINVTFMNNDRHRNLSSRFGEKKVTKSRVKVTKSVTKSRVKVTKSVTKSRKKVTKSKTLTLDLDTLALT